MQDQRPEEILLLLSAVAFSIKSDNVIAVTVPAGKGVQEVTVTVGGKTIMVDPYREGTQVELDHERCITDAQVCEAMCGNCTGDGGDAGLRRFCYRRRPGHYADDVERIAGRVLRLDHPETPNPTGSSYLSAVACPSPSVCEAVGHSFNSKGVEITLAEAWNGTAWTIQKTPSPGADSYL
jgi:hypothetical protein